MSTCRRRFVTQQSARSADCEAKWGQFLTGALLRFVVVDKEDRSIQPRPIPYADSRLAIGSAGYRSYAYPSDHAGFWIPAQLTSDGNILKLQPGPVCGRFIGAGLVIVGCIAALALMAKGSSFHEGMARLVLRPSRWVLVIAVVLIVQALHRLRRRQLRPWLIVDRAAQLIRLPRSKKSIRFADVVRLQLVSCVPVGFSKRNLSYRGNANSGELQIVFTDHAQEQTWCIVAWPSEQVVKRFVEAFHLMTGIPVSRVNYLVTGNWQVDAFDANGNRE